MSVLMFALGIGAVTSVFSVLNTVVLRSSYPEADRLFLVDELVPDLAERHVADAFPVNARHFELWREACTACESMGLARSGGGANLTGDGPPERVRMLSVTHDFLPTLGVVPQLGRALLPADDEPDAPRALLLSDAFWRRRFHADPSVVGSEIRLNGELRTIVGVLPGDFEGLAGDYLPEFRLFDRDFDAVTPLRLRYAAVRGAGNYNFGAVVRLRPGATARQATDQMNAAIAPFVEEFNRPMAARLRPLDQTLLGDSSTGLWMLLAAVGGLLAIVCVNVSALLIVRAERRRGEAAVRRALGASVFRLLGQALRESVALSFVGGAAGLLAAYWAVEGIVLLAPADLPRLAQVRVDVVSVGVAFLATLLAGALAAALPALRFARVPIEGALREHQSSSTQSAARSRSRDFLIAGEVALSAILLMTAGLVGAGFFRLLAVDRGFVTENVASFDLVLPPQDYPANDGSRGRFHDALLERLRTTPGVQSVGFTNKIPLEGTTWVDSVRPAGAVQAPEDRLAAEFRFVSADYWRAMGVRLVSGRYLTPEDRDRKTAVLSRAAARKLWPGESAVGRQFHGGPGEKTPWEVVGVVDDVRTASLDADASPIVYLSYWLLPRDSVSYAVRTAAAPAGLADVVHEAVWSVDPALPVVNLRTMSQVVERSTAQQRFQALMATVFAAFALLLASLGIYGVVAYLAVRRRHEIGLRLALGAEASGVLRLILGQSMRPVLAGLIVGLACAAWLGRWIESLLFDVSAHDPTVFASVAAVLLVVSALACYLPARRASRTDPATALRND